MTEILQTAQYLFGSDVSGAFCAVDAAAVVAAAAGINAGPILPDEGKITVSWGMGGGGEATPGGGGGGFGKKVVPIPKRPVESSTALFCFIQLPSLS